MEVYLKNLFTTFGCTTDPILRSVSKKGTEAQNQMLTNKFEAREIKEAVFSMHLDKSQGPDGMNLGFYQAYWDIVCGQVTEHVWVF